MLPRPRCDYSYFDIDEILKFIILQNVLSENQPTSSNGAPRLLALTGMSNVSNSKNPLSLCAYAKKLGYYTLLDAAALATTSVINLTETPVDAMAVSFYKMFGFPTGVGALIVKEEFLRFLQRPWFAGGTVSLVQAPGMVFTMAENPMERFEVRLFNAVIVYCSCYFTGWNHQLLEPAGDHKRSQFPVNLSSIPPASSFMSSSLSSRRAGKFEARCQRCACGSYSLTATHPSTEGSR